MSQIWLWDLRFFEFFIDISFFYKEEKKSDFYSFVFTYDNNLQRPRPNRQNPYCTREKGI